MMRGSGVTYPDTSAQQNRHRDTTAAHVLDLGDLVDDSLDSIQDEISKHKIDHWSYRHRSAPPAKPTKPRSQMGVSRRRSAP